MKDVIVIVPWRWTIVRQRQHGRSRRGHLHQRHREHHGSWPTAGPPARQRRSHPHACSAGGSAPKPFQPGDRCRQLQLLPCEGPARHAPASRRQGWWDRPVRHRSILTIE